MYKRSFTDRSRYKNSNLSGYSAGSSFLRNKFLCCLSICLVLVWSITAVSPYDRFDWFLENLLVFVFLIILIAIYPYFQFSNLSYFLIAVFMSFHLIGAHYSYTETPFDTIIKVIFGFKRNHFDRVVHFLFGLLISYPILELLVRIIRIGRYWAYTFTIVIMLAAGAFYELIEMWVAKIVTPDLGILFLGTQGDPWDTQSDIAMAFYGSIIAIFVTFLVKYYKDMIKNKHRYIGFGG